MNDERVIGLNSVCSYLILCLELALLRSTFSYGRYFLCSHRHNYRCTRNRYLVYRHLISAILRAYYQLARANNCRSTKEKTSNNAYLLTDVQVNFSIYYLHVLRYESDNIGTSFCTFCFR